MRTIDIIKIYRYAVVTEVYSIYGKYKVTLTEDAKELLKVDDMDENRPYFFDNLIQVKNFYDNLIKLFKI